MTLHARRSFQAVILAALGLFLLSKIWSGTFFWYLNQRFLLLTLIAATGFLAMPLVVLLNRKKDAGEVPPPEQDHAPRQDHAHDHAHQPVRGLIVVALPLILGVIIPARPLSASAVANKELNTTAALAASGNVTAAELNITSTERTVLDWVRAFNYESKPAIFEGQMADVVGFVYHDARLPAGQFLAGRFAITHCVAEAVAIGVIVDWPKAALADNLWVRVKGPIRVATLNGKPIPMIVAESVEQIAEPARPYLYP